MKILMVNKFYYIKGGSETYYFNLKDLLEDKGHTVIDFSMKDEKNHHSEYERYFVENIDYDKNMSLIQKIKMASSIIYSREAKDKFEQLVRDTQPDLVHLHIFQHQLSPSILDVIKKYDLPAVYTAHELKMICPNYKMLQHGMICEQCKGNAFFHCMTNKCIKDSLAKSLVGMIEGYVHLARKSYDCIDYIITPSRFYREKFIEFGIKAEKVVYIPNFLDRVCPEVRETDKTEVRFLYLGRLSEEKGIQTLISAACKVHTPLDIVGTGPLSDRLEKRICETGQADIRLLGFRSGQELIDIVGNAKAVILPSEWYENGPYSAIEALQLGRPIIGADIGGIPELVSQNGYLFKSGDIKGLSKVMTKMYKLSKEKYQLMKGASRKLFKKRYTSSTHYPQLLDIYDRAIYKHKTKRT